MTTTTPRQTARIAEYLNAHRSQLELLERMWNDPRVQCYNDKDMPSEEELKLGSAFLAGPTTWHQILEYNWRCQAVAHLREAGYAGYIYVPETRGMEKSGDYPNRTYIHYWESDRLVSALYRLFWIPRNANELLGLNTNFEFGWQLRDAIAAKTTTTNLFIGWPPEAARMGLPNHYATERADCKRYYTLRRMCFAVMGKVPPDDDPTQDIAECDIPL